MPDRLRKLLEDAAASNGRLQAIRKRMEQGKATFADTAEYSELLSDLLGEIFAHHVEQLTKPMEKETICKQLLQEHYESINKTLAKVQQELDAQREIHIRPQQAAFPAERVQKVAHALEDPTVSIDTIRRRANAPVANVAKSFHDDYIKENAKFCADAGLKCWIVRTTDGKCCKWCTQVAGRYEYGTEPEDVYRRHDNCGCMTVYENGRIRQHVWSKKYWSDEKEREYLKKLDEKKKAKRLAAKQARELKEKNKPTILAPAQGRALQTKHKPTVLTRGRKSGIIMTEENALYRKKVSEKVEPMPKKQFQRIVKRFKTQGGLIQYNDEIDAYLRNKNAEAITYDATLILIRQNPGRASVFEELIHTAQYRNGRNDGSYLSRLRCEIEAQEKLLQYAKIYKLTQPEILQTQRALESYQKELDDYLTNGGV
ncbi:MAG: hypothetical protein PUC41_05165 [Oscillospiraceae bacterium]|nr:hypothetical protein [Oscillospiraceae bacterium]